MKTPAIIVALCFAALTRAADYQIEGNIRYDHYAETVLDILQARAPALKNRPAVIVIHGGGWIQGDKESMLERFCLPFIQHDFVVANVEYRLAKAATAPAAVEDVLKAARWVEEHAADYKIDAGHIIVLGSSAGGHLALLTGMLPASNSFGPVIKLSAVIDFYGIADVADQIEGPNERPYAVDWIPEQPDRMELARRLSPITYVRKGLPPVLAIHGDADPTVPYAQSVRLIKALKAAGDDAELITVSGGQHGFEPGEMEKLWPPIFKWLKKRKIGS
ncbi:MAG TPA: alpha/beta hydrolase [Bryobacteraceae bacterium]|nr:alpha/beta hydrolase [Bryobacteraceae bacterium]